MTAYRVLSRWGVALLLTASALAVLPSAQAHFSDEHGWLSVHDTATGPDSDQTDRRVQCDFWVRGHAVTHVNGTLIAVTSGSFGGIVQELGEWVGTPNADGTFSFLAGPFDLEGAGGVGESWTVFGNMYDDEGGHSISSPSFRWSCPEDDPEGAPADCPADVSVTATDEGNWISWSYRDNGGEFRLYRDGHRIAVVDGEERAYLDAEVEAGETYAYRVTFASALPESEDCQELVTTAVPFFGGAVGTALAVLGGVGAVVWMRRRA